MIVVAGPRIDPANLPRHDGLEIRGYVHELYRHLAACDLAVVQGGLTTAMELTANRRPFLYFPLRHHFEQNFHVRHRLARYGAGRCMDFETDGPEEIAAAEEIGREVDYRPVETDGAARAANLIAERCSKLLGVQRAFVRCTPNRTALRHRYELGLEEEAVGQGCGAAERVSAPGLVAVRLLEDDNGAVRHPDVLDECQEAGRRRPRGPVPGGPPGTLVNVVVPTDSQSKVKGDVISPSPGGALPAGAASAADPASATTTARVKPDRLLRMSSPFAAEPPDCYIEVPAFQCGRRCRERPCLVPGTRHGPSSCVASRLTGPNSARARLQASAGASLAAASGARHRFSSRPRLDRHQEDDDEQDGEKRARQPDQVGVAGRAPGSAPRRRAGRRLAASPAPGSRTRRARRRPTGRSRRR